MQLLNITFFHINSLNLKIFPKTETNVNKSKFEWSKSLFKKKRNYHFKNSHIAADATAVLTQAFICHAEAQIAMIYTFYHLPFYNAFSLEPNFTKNGCGEGNFTRPPFPCWFSLINKFRIPYSSQSPDIRQNSDKGVSDFRISGQFFICENCHNSRTSHDIDMKVGPVTKFDNRNRATSKNFEDDVMSTNRDAIVFLLFMVNLQSSGSRFQDAWSIKFRYSLRVTFFLTKTENRIKTITQLSYYCFESRYYFCQTILIFCKKVLTSAKFNRSWY